ncbi:hypothetical protein FHG87_016213 [Trinorchestia longiramus]|nr:hypothetical protein FHG87_016213 [Trinorchestia longiramus]
MWDPMFAALVCLMFALPTIKARDVIIYNNAVIPETYHPRTVSGMTKACACLYLCTNSTNCKMYSAIKTNRDVQCKLSPSVLPERSLQPASDGYTVQVEGHVDSTSDVDQQAAAGEA